MSQFDREWNAAIKKIYAAGEKTFKGAVIDLFSQIVKRTPVGNQSLWKSPRPKGYVAGSLRGNWQLSLTSPNYSEVDVEDKGGGPTISKASSALRALRFPESVYFTNNLPYAERVENGWSQQRPQGMMRVTVKQWSKLIERQARKNKI